MCLHAKHNISFLLVWLSIAPPAPLAKILNTRLCLKLIKIFVIWKLQKLEFYQNKENQQVTIKTYLKKYQLHGLKVLNKNGKGI